MDEIAELLRASLGDFEKPLRDNPAGVARLAAATDAVRQSPEPGPVASLPVVARQITGKTYVFDPNPAKLESIAFKFDGSAEATLFIKPSGGTLASALAGLDGVYRFSPGSDNRPVGFRGAWTDAQTFLLEYDGVTNNDHRLFQFRFEGDRVEVSVHETDHEVGAQFVGRLQESPGWTPPAGFALIGPSRPGAPRFGRAAHGLLRQSEQ